MIRIHVCIACLVALLGLRLLAQESRGVISGVVTDASGSVVANAKVAAVHIETNVETATKSNETGSYTLPYLPPGVYNVTAEMAGFRKRVHENVEVSVGDRLDLDFKLEVSGVTTTVEVTAEDTPLLETVSASSGSVVDHRSITELPLGDGNPFTLTNMAAGVVFTNDTMNNMRPYDDNGTSAIRVSGAPGGNSFTLDGAPNTGTNKGTQKGGFVSYVPPAGAVQEFKIETLAFDAQHGAAGGANVNVSLKGGTNNLHGSLYEFYRPDTLVAQEFFAKRTGLKAQSFLYHRYGGTVGGPVWIPKLYHGKNRSFFFFAYEGIVNDRPQVGLYTTPTVAERTGDFSQLLSQKIAIYDPATAKQVSSSRIGRDPFAGNLIPASRLSQIALNYLKYYPQPNVAGNAQGQQNFLGNDIQTDRFNSELIRFDHLVSDRQRLSVRLNQYYRNRGNGLGWAGIVNGIKPTYVEPWRSTSGGSFDYLYTLTPTDILDLRAGVTRAVDGKNPVDPGFNIASLGFPAATVAQFQGASYIPQFSLNDYDSLGGNEGKKTTYNVLFLQPTYTGIRGRHMLKAGYDIRAYQQNYGPLAGSAVMPSFDSTYTRGPQDNSSSYIGQDLASLLLGIPSGGSIGRLTSSANQNLLHGIFLQDDFRVLSRLTLNLGLRYELEGATTERYNRNVRGFDFSTPSPIDAAARALYAANPDPQGPIVSGFRVLGGYLFASPSHRGFWNADTNNIQPRVGAAFQITPKTVLRGGWGMFMVPFFIDSVYQDGFSQSTPIVVSQNSGLTFSANLANPFPNGVLEPAGAAGGLGTFMGQDVTFASINRRNGLVQRWSAMIQHQVRQWLLEASYQASRGYDLSYGVNLDPLARQYQTTQTVRDQPVIDLLDAKVKSPFNNLIPGVDISGSTIKRSQLLLPYPQFLTITGERNDGSSMYQGVHFRVQRRMRGGLLLQSAYSYSHLRERLSLLNDTDLNPEDHTSRDDRPHRIVMTGIWEVPLGHARKWGSGWNRALDTAFGGWQLGSVFIAQSGRPMKLGNVYYSGDVSSLATSFDKTKADQPMFDTSGFYFHDSTVQTNGVDDIAKQRADKRIQLSYNIRTVPSVPDNFRGDRIINLDLSLIKTIRLRERMSLQIRGEALNTMNRVQFDDPGVKPKNADFGIVSTTTNPTRQVQFAARLVF